MKIFLTGMLFLFSVFTQAQIGVGTTSPNSTFDIRGSLSTALTTFTANTTAGASDNMFVFTGTSAATLTLPTAAGITGREYWIKNSSSNSSVLTIATTSSQTIDGLSSWTLTQTNKTIRVVSNGSNWYAAAESLPGSTGTPWTLGGNNVVSQQNIGTTSNYAMPFITNNTEKMRLTTSGSLGIGTSTFNATYPEKLLVDAGTTTSVNAIVGKGTINSYLQLNIQNLSSGTAASSDVVATANNGDETTNYVDMGINGGGYTGGVMGAANDAYLYNLGQNFLIGTGTASKTLVFMTGGTSQATNERMRINGSGNVAIGTTTWNGSNPEKLIVDAGTSTSVNLIRSIGNTNFIVRNSVKNSSSGTAAGADFRVYNDNDNTLVAGINSSGYSGSSIYHGAGDAQLYSNANDFLIGNTVANKNLRFYTGGIATSNERMRINGTGSVGIGTSTFSGTYPERLIVDAGASGNTNYQNVIVGKGNTNSYAQLNIQNINAGTGASSDVVATADNGSETTNYVDMGINSSTNTSGVMGGANDSYLYNMGQNFLIGTGTAAKSLVFMTGGTTQSTNERLRIDGSGNVGIGTTNPSYKLHVLAVSNPLYLLGVQTGASTDSFLTITGGVVRKLHSSALSSSSWALNGNSVASQQNIGTISNYALPFITNNTEKMRLTTSGNLGLGTSTFDGTNPEKLLVDAGTTTSVNAIVGKGTINSYLQLNIKNNSSGTAASSDVVATADNGSETTNYVDMGINSSGNTSAVMGGANDSYLYNMGQNFLIGTGTAAKSLVFMTGGTTQSTNERLRIDGSGNVGIGTTNPSYKLHVLAASNPLYLLGVQTGASTDSFLTITGGVVRKLHSSALSSSSWALNGNSVSSQQNIGTTSNYALPFITNNTEKMRLTTSGNLGIGTSTFDATYPEKLLVDAGTTTSVNAIVGKGTINSYLQLNIKNGSSGTAASSDVVATADNGSETTNYVDMGINSSGNTSGAMGVANDAYLYNMGQNLLIGTGTAAKSLVFMTGGTTQSTNERMRINGTGSVGIGTSTFNATYPERLQVDAGSTGNTNYQNVIVGKGNTNSYAQLNIQNSNTGTAASSDVVATANNGTESVNFIDMGINGGGNTSTGVLGGANTAYIYGTGSDMAIGNATSAKDVILFTGGTATTNERLRATANGLTMTGSHTVSYRSGTGNYTLLTTDYVVINTGGAATWTLPAASGCAGRVYRLLNHGTANITLSIAVYTANATTTTALAFATGTNFYEIVSDGTSWRVIN